MSIKVVVNTTPKNRIAIKQPQTTVKTVNFGSVVKLEQLNDVDASSPNTNDTLVYDEVTGKYVVRELPIINGGTF